jgi:hypothetical protein
VSTDSPASGLPPQLLLGALVVLVVAGLSAVAFRRRT